MEAKIRGEGTPFCNSVSPGATGFGKRNMEWDLTDWRWDGDLFVATPTNATPSDCRNKQLFPVPALGGVPNCSSSSSGESDPGISGKGKVDSEKRRREVDDADEPEDEAGSLTLKLGGRVYPVTHVDLANWDGKNGKKSKVQVGTVCQVEGCGADLGDAKDYHRRHKVCEMHAKASKALVGNVLQRFCQQCSRFHLLQEFDEGKRSCRRRLAGHNRRRRKTQPDGAANGVSLMDDHASSYLLISLLRILTNLQPDGSEQLKDQDLLSHLLKNLANLAGPLDTNKLPGILQTSQERQKIGTSAGTSSEAAHALTSNVADAQELTRPVCSSAETNCPTEIQGSTIWPIDQPVSVAVASAEMPRKRNIMETSPGESAQLGPCGRSTKLVLPQDGIPVATEGFPSLNQILPTGSTAEKVRFKSFDLNDVCDDGHDRTEGPEKLVTSASQPYGSVHCSSWALHNSHKSSPLQTSHNSDSASAQSQSTSSGDAQSRTDRMVFKLFGKDPSDLPLVLRNQILDWLSNSPTDIEGYIRPGCIVLTVYLRLPESKWEELHHNLRPSLERLFDVAGDDFWGTGWVYARIQNQIAFVYNGCVVLDTPLLNNNNHSQILSITPIAVSASETVSFTVKGLNLTQSSIRLLCAFEGKYLVQEMTQALARSTDTSTEQDEAQCLHFSCSVPKATGRGFIEVEDHGLSSSFFPFIVAEEEVSSEICTLEGIFNGICSDGKCGDRASGEKSRTQAFDFLHEMGWLLRRSHLRSSSEHRDSPANIYPLTQFIWLMEFAMDHNWCAVVKKLLDVLFSGAVSIDGYSVELALSEMALLHNAVQKNQRTLVELLLGYVPPDDLECVESQSTQLKHCREGFLFRPDMIGPFDVTPLHIAASRCDAENVLDALTDDPGQLGIQAWKSARDSSGFTPEDYACSRGYQSYVHLVQEKIKQKSGEEQHVVVDIPGTSADQDVIQKQPSGSTSTKATGFQIDERNVPLANPSCRLCILRRPSCGIDHGNLTYRPMMLFMVGIAAVCVCVGILLHTPPEVFSVVPPFRWELLDYGYI